MMGSRLPARARWIALAAAAVACSESADGGPGSVGGAGGSGGSSGGSSVGGSMVGSGGAVTSGSGGAGGAMCGNGVIEPGEECDAAAANGPGSGCEDDCRFSCHIDGDCSDGEPCNGTETCAVNSAGRACALGTPPPESSACGLSSICKNGSCVPSVCGNGVVEAGETCEPPSTATCDASCHSLLCGDGVIGGVEQCDDGNGENLDGCDALCRYETVLRATKIETSKDPAATYCPFPGNALGAASSQAFLDLVNSQSASDVAAGNTNLLFQLRDLDDLTGQSDPAVSVSFMLGQLDPNKGTWTANSIDWWFTVDPSYLNANGDPVVSSLGTIAGGVLTSGGQDFTLGPFFIRNWTLRAVIDTTPAPNVPAPPPSALAAGLSVFQSMHADQIDLGMCGAVTVGSLAQIPLPEGFTQGAGQCLSSCPKSKTYTFCGTGNPVGPGCNSLLDTIVGGCQASALCADLVTATQPDVGVNGNPPNVLTNGVNNKVTVIEPLDGYSVVHKITANRTHITNNLP